MEQLAARARNKSNPPTRAPSDPRSLGRNSSNPRETSVKSGCESLPKSIFDNTEHRKRYQNHVQQLRSGSGSDERVIKAASNGVSTRQSTRRPLSKEEDEFETNQMLAEPKRLNQWTNGLHRKNSVEQEKPTAENNSFLARRAALQNRLKNL